MKLLTDKEIDELPRKLGNLLNQLADVSKSPAKRDVLRDRMDALLLRMIAALKVAE